MSTYYNSIPNKATYRVGDLTAEITLEDNKQLLQISQGEQRIYFYVEDVDSIINILNDFLIFVQEKDNERAKQNTNT